jgi:hypothetical protein
LVCNVCQLQQFPSITTCLPRALGVVTILHTGKRRRAKVAQRRSAGMPASRAVVSLFSLLAMALLLWPVSAEPPRLSPATGGIDEWLGETVTALQATAPGAGGTEGGADGIARAPAPGRPRRFRLPSHPFALSPEARRELEHETRCGPRIPVRRGSPWPERKPRCRSGDDGDAGDESATGTAGAPTSAWLP